MQPSTRRRFFGVALTGAATVSLPGILGCRRDFVRAAAPTLRASAPPAAPPAQAPTTYFDAFGVSEGLLRRVIARGLSRGGAYCEVFLQHKVSHWLGVEDEEVNRAYSEVMLGAGVRVLKGDATGYAFTEDLSEAALMSAATTAAAVADGPARTEIPALSPVSVPKRYEVAIPWTRVGVDAKLPIVKRADATARALDPSIAKVRVFLEDETSRIVVADSEGRLVEDDQPMALLSVSCVAERNGQTETGWDSLAARDALAFFTAERVDRVARHAAERAVLLFGASQPPAGEYPVVLAPGLSGIFLHEAIGHGMEADFNRKGISIYADRIGKKIAAPFVTIVDDGTNERLRGSIAVDDEGTSAQRTVLVEDGILRSYLHDRISSEHFRSARTGSGRRESFRFPPVPRMRNTYMLPGPHDPGEIVASVKKGLYCEMFTNGEVRIGAGDFTFFLKHGRMIEDGKLTRVVKDANLIGSGPAVLERVDMVGSDLEMISGGGYCGKDGQRVPVGFGLPTVRAGGISVGGKKS